MEKTSPVRVIKEIPEGTPFLKFKANDRNYSLLKKKFGKEIKAMCQTDDGKFIKVTFKQ